MKKPRLQIKVPKPVLERKVEDALIGATVALVLCCFALFAGVYFMNC